MFLVLIETSGNQNYIFSTNKLKENIGASELTYRAGTSWVVEAVDLVRGASESIHEVGRWVEEAIERSISTGELRKKLLDVEDWNKPIEAEDSRVEVIVATSGKALLLTKNEDIAKSIIRYVTHKAIRYAPGLDISGVISDEFEWGNALGKTVREVHKKHEAHRSQKPSLDLRFLRLPIFDECATSGLPASTNKDSISGKYISQVSAAKQNMGAKALDRLSKLVNEDPRQIRFVKTIRELNTKFEDELDWLAVIHADGNGLGQIFMDFEEYIQKLDSLDSDSQDRQYVKALRKFSIALDICTEKAFLKALDCFLEQKPKNNQPKKILKSLQPNTIPIVWMLLRQYNCMAGILFLRKSFIPLVPLILGGDDLTVVCNGKTALQFTQKFLETFEAETQEEQEVEGAEIKINIIPKIAQSAFGVERLSACAGIAIVKPHFPFSVAYELSEALMKSAKKVKEIVKKEVVEDNPGDEDKAYPCSALDFHILYDTSNVNLDLIRSKLEKDDGKTKLYGRPYVITSETNLQGATGSDWVKVHKWDLLQTRVKALKAKDENDNNRRNLPSSQIHSLREDLFLGREVAEARYKLIRNRYLKEGIDKLEFQQSPGSLFCQEGNSETYVTGLLDAIEAAEFIN